MNPNDMRKNIDGVLVTSSIIPPSKAHPFVLKATKFAVSIFDSARDSEEVKAFIEYMMSDREDDLEIESIINPLIDVVSCVDDKKLFEIVGFLCDFAVVGGVNGTFDEKFFSKPLDMPYKVAYFVADANFRQLFIDAARKYLPQVPRTAESKDTHQTPI